MPKILTDCYKIIDSQGFQVIVSSEVVTECLSAEKSAELTLCFRTV